MRVRILVYKGFHATAPRRIKDALTQDFPGIKRLWLNHPEMTFRPRPGDYVLNWGCRMLPDFWPHGGYTVINHPSVVGRNRLQALTTLKEGGINVPDFTTLADVARQWLNDGKSVVCRSGLRTFGGRGITLVEGPNASLPSSALYAVYRPKRTEYRVHVFNGQVIDVQQKKRRQGDRPEGLESKIRSYGNGWVFAREGVTPPQSVLQQALGAVESLGLAFSAVDIGWNEHYQQATVYECNTAPGLEGTSINLYADAIRKYIRGVA